MLRAFSSAVTAMRAQMTYMDIVANNIANVNTTGFKSQRGRFADMLYQTISSGSPANDTAGSSNPMQVGLGVRVAGIDNNMNQGALRNTGNPFDLAIEGEGFFAVKDSTGSTFYTRDGGFGLDSEGRLINPASGWLVQGVGGGEITIDSSQYASISIGPDGKIVGALIDGSGTEEIGQIGLSTFANPGGLVRAGDNMWKLGPASGTPTEGAPLSEGRGNIRSGQLEGSNTDLALEFTNMISAQRGFQAQSRVITTSDELLQDLVNIKR